jgi:hypothetical protein
MIHFVNQVLVNKLGFQPEQNYVTLEARMHCGIGKCGRCNLGDKLICVDGPVFSMAEVGSLLESFMYNPAQKWKGEVRYLTAPTSFGVNLFRSSVKITRTCPSAVNRIT